MAHWTFEHWVIFGYFFGVMPLIAFLWWHSNKWHETRRKS